INNTSIGTSASSSRVRLEPISLPTFSGDIQDWESFFDCFRVMVHEDTGLSSAQKFYYLRSSLAGAALNLVKSVPMTDINYEIAINRLKQRYDNRGLVIQSHIRSILDTPHIQKPTASELQGLHAHICVHIAALKALKQPTDQWDAWLVTIIVSRLDPATSQDWQLRQESTDLPRYEALESFISNRCVALENSDFSKQISSEVNNQQITSRKKEYEQKSKKLTLIAGTENIICHKCNGQHKIYACESFKKLTTLERLNVIRDAKLCFNCLSGFHLANVCKSRFSCSRCHRRHNTLLHLEGRSDNANNNVTNNVQEENSLPVSSPQVSMAATLENSYVFLSTAVVLVTDNNGRAHKCRAVLDSGSQLNFISKGLQNKLKLPSERILLPVCGIGTSRLQTTSRVNVQILACVSSFNLNMACHVIPTVVSDLPAYKGPKDGWKISNKLATQLADPKFDQAGPVDLLIGAGIFFDILTSERIPLNVGNMSLQGTKLGYVVTGEIGTTCLLGISRSLEENWEAIQPKEEQLFGRYSKLNLRCAEEQEVVNHFMKTFTRNSDGRFVLRLPTNSKIDELGDSLNMAICRFMNVERRLQRDNQLRVEYINFMTEYLEMGHMEEIKDDVTTMPIFYLPHHAVIKSSSLTTKVRVVFDASAKGSNSIALNDVLMRGPTIQEDLFSILSRFRKHQIVITADIEKMFRQVEVAKEDRDLQRIVWRKHPSEVLRKYRLNTVTYGTTPASFMTTKCLDELARENEVLFPNASKTIRRDFYMDDIMTGSDSEEECLKLQQDVTNILNSAKLPLRKWCSNSGSILEKIEKVNNDPLFVLNLGDDETIKSLGLSWKPYVDEFRFYVTRSMDVNKVTKRTLLSDLNKVFDPLGFLAPVLIKGKIFLQQLWQLKIDWDTPLQDNIRQSWQQYYTQIETLKELSIPRKAKPGAGDMFELHGFCDASGEAYGACVYVRYLNQYGQWKASLLCSKTRVAPLRSVTIPRLELNGALLLVQLSSKVAQSWGTDVKNFKLWSDSMVVLGWLNSQTSRLKTYVANRVEQILEVTDAFQWHYTNTNDNPADIISRGIDAQELSQSVVWWNGPSYLSLPENQWPNPMNKLIPCDELPEQRPIKLVLVTIEKSKDIINAYSKWRSLVRAVAWLSRFVNYLKNKRSTQSRGYLTLKEIKLAEVILLKRAQNDVFHSEFKRLSNGRDIERNSTLKTLHPFLKDGLILVGGRLQNSNLTREQKHPVVLPFNHKVTRLIFQDHHVKMLHCVRNSFYRKFVTNDIALCSMHPGKTKAIHIEVVEDLTSNSFIATLRRFMARRGKPAEIWSDNATNFVGAQRELANYLQNIEGCTVDEGITWHFIPPSAPHFGGLWESAVKSAKHHLTRVLKDAKLTLVELQTLLCQVEACLNSRPLTPISNDPNDLQALTPAHFLIGGPMLSYPEPDLSQEESNGLRRWRFVQFLMQDFWQRWHKEYLPQLQTRGKWTSGTSPLKLNDIVIVKEDNLPPARWKLARIISVHPGSDGRIRVVTVRLANGNEIKRPTVKLCRLPVEEKSEDP
ncbi:Uncharacterized protein FWK35_00034883, partial [Aphis craccivora]